jgi:hypothetical protein
MVKVATRPAEVIKISLWLHILDFFYRLIFIKYLCVISCLYIFRIPLVLWQES